MAVKPSAQPTLVRTKHLPRPAETVPEPRVRGQGLASPGSAVCGSERPHAGGPSECVPGSLLAIAGSQVSRVGLSVLRIVGHDPWMTSLVDSATPNAARAGMANIESPGGRRRLRSMYHNECRSCRRRLSRFRSHGDGSGRRRLRGCRDCGQHRRWPRSMPAVCGSRQTIFAARRSYMA
jgi:hypothetical protein